MDDREMELQQAYAAMQYMGAAIKTRREKLKKSIKAISVTTKIPCEEIELLERGGDNGRSSDIWVLCEVLGMDYAALMMEALEYAKTHRVEAMPEEKAPTLKIIKGGLYKEKS